MFHSIKGLLILGAVLTFMLAACTPASAPEPQSTVESEITQSGSAGSDSSDRTADVTVELVGAVSGEQSWTEAQLRAMDTIKSQATNSQGEQDTYTGVPIHDLLSAAQPLVGAANVIFSDADGNKAEFPLEQILNCGDCILSFRNRGGFSVVIPGNDPDLPIRGVVRIEVQ